MFHVIIMKRWKSTKINMVGVEYLRFYDVNVANFNAIIIIDHFTFLLNEAVSFWMKIDCSLPKQNWKWILLSLRARENKRDYYLIINTELRIGAPPTFDNWKLCKLIRNRFNWLFSFEECIFNKNNRCRVDWPSNISHKLASDPRIDRDWN